jgi:hypothetical protein
MVIFTSDGSDMAVTPVNNVSKVPESRDICFDANRNLKTLERPHLHSFHPKKGYPEKLRRIRFYDKEFKRSTSSEDNPITV